jgi:hypothetical protein
MATDHRLKVYRALRRADPEGFAALLSRKDVWVGWRRFWWRLVATL